MNEITIKDAASQLRIPIDIVEKACYEYLKKANAVMLNKAEMQDLTTHFQETSSKKAQRAPGGRGRHGHSQSGKRSSSSGAKFQVHERKARGQQRVTANRLNVARLKVVEQVADQDAVPQAVPQAEARPAAGTPIARGEPTASMAQAAAERMFDTLQGKEKQPAAAMKASLDPVAQEPVVVEKPKGKGPVPVDKITLSAALIEKRKMNQRKKRAKSTTSTDVGKQDFVLPGKRRVLIIEIPEEIALRDLSYQMSVKYADVLAKLSQWMEVDKEQPPETVDQDTACFLVEEFKNVAQRVQAKQANFVIQKRAAEGTEVVVRPPVVTVMGHVDHGKTSLLDFIRKSKVADKEDGGITQHIGAYQVDTAYGKITFIDTPGHEVFTEMRARGASVTDIVVLVVAADDGVQPQTREAIAHATAAEAPIIVAINKMDLEHADPDKVMKELASLGIEAEQIGGNAVTVPVSAMTGAGVDKLLENVSLLAELLELRAPLDVDARGSIIEAHMEKGLGAVVTVIVKDGVLRKGDFMLCDTEYGRVRALRSHDNKLVKEAMPSTPVQIQGIAALPSVGSEFFVAKEEQSARAYAEEQRDLLRQRELAQKRVVIEANSLDELFAQADKQEEDKVLNLVVKTDVAGTCEAMGNALLKIGNEEAKLKVIHIGVGAISESDVSLAHASDATLVGFRVTANPKARAAIRARNLEAVYSDVFYEVTDQLKDRLLGLLEPTKEEHLRGTAKVKEVFHINKIGKIAGCVVEDGTISSKLPIRVVRDGKIVFKTEISELRHYKNEANTVNAGSDCGIRLRRFSDFKPGDLLETYEVKIIAKTL